MPEIPADLSPIDKTEPDLQGHQPNSDAAPPEQLPRGCRIYLWHALLWLIIVAWANWEHMEPGVYGMVRWVFIGLFCAPVFALVSMGCIWLFKVTNATKKPGKTTAAIKGITWSQYITDCGLDAQKTNEARTEHVFTTLYKGSSVHWTGVVYSVRKNFFGNGFRVNIRMSPTESSLGAFDLTLSAGQDLEEEVTALNEGDRVEFEAVFRIQGGLVGSHQFDLQHIELPHPPARKSRR